MNKKAELALTQKIRKKIISFNRMKKLPGLNNAVKLDCLSKHIVDSIKRISFITDIKNSKNSILCEDVVSDEFNPYKAAAFHKRHGNIDEAFWLIFLATHFGEDERDTHWQLLKDVYAGLGRTAFWSWRKTSTNPDGFRQWLEDNINEIKEHGGKFGNHRKRESLMDAFTGETVANYINWIGYKHQDIINNIYAKAGASRYDRFDALYNSMQVFRFGRTAKFDYLTMAGKLGLAEIEPGSPYIDNGTTGPKKGARLLFGGNEKARIGVTVLNTDLRDLGKHLDLYFGMQVIEDAVCNWEKNVSKYISSLP